MLSQEQVDSYQENGFLVFPETFPEAELAGLRQAAARIVGNFDTGQHRTVFKTTDQDAGRDDYFFDSAERVHCFLEEEALNAQGDLAVDKAVAINKIGHALHDHVPEFRAFCSQDWFGALLRDLGMHLPVLWQTMYIYKQPRIGGEVRWHQDASYLVSKPPTVTGVWVALEDAWMSNGCLHVAPGWHRGPLREIYEVDWARRKGQLRTLDSMPWPGENEGEAVEIRAGGVIVFHDHLPHYSSPNRSNRSRQALTLHFADADSQWSDRNWLQRHTLPPFTV